MSTLTGTSSCAEIPSPGSVTLQNRSVRTVSTATGSLLLQPASIVASVGSHVHLTVTGWRYQP